MEKRSQDARHQCEDLDRLTAEKQLPVRRIGRRVLITRDALHNLLNVTTRQGRSCIKGKGEQRMTKEQIKHRNNSIALCAIYDHLSLDAIGNNTI